jgi:hypothetical protein
MLKTTTSIINASQIAGVLPVVNGGTGVTTSTGTGNTVLSTSPTLATPILGVASGTSLTLIATDTGAAAAPLLELYRDSASPAASDTLGEIEFNGEDSAGNKQAYGVIHASILSPTTTAEQGQIHFETATAGALTEKMIIGTTNLVINEIGAVFNVRIEGDTDANLFFTDATNSRVGVGTISPAEKLDVVGNIKLTGNVVVANGQGIDFSATPGTGTSELLNDYEEGTWTPVVEGSSTAGTATYGAQVGQYTKIGNRVYVNLTVSYSEGTGTGNLQISGLPFASNSTTNNFQTLSIYAGSLTLSSLQVPVPLIAANSSTILINYNTVGGGAEGNVPYDAAAFLVISGSYVV